MSDNNRTLGYDHNDNANTSTEDLECEYYMEICGLFDYVIEAVLMGLLCAFGFVGNSLSTVCLLRDRSKSATPFLLVSLETADTMFLVSVLLLRVITTLAETYADDLPWLTDMVPYIGKYVYPWAMIAETGTIYMTVLVTVNRFIAVCRPFDATDVHQVKKQSRRHVLLVVFFSVLFNASRFFEYEIHSSDNASLPNKLQESSLKVNPYYKIIYSTVLYSLIMFLIPLVSLVILNNKLMVALRQTRRKRDAWRSHRSVTARRQSSNGTGEQPANSNNNSRSEDDITRMLIVVVLVFVVSQSPALITQAIFALTVDDDGQTATETCTLPVFFFYVRLSDLFVVANSSLNFIIYSFCSKRFRKILISLMSCQHGVNTTRTATHSLVVRGQGRSQYQEGQVDVDRRRSLKAATTDDNARLNDAALHVIADDSKPVQPDVSHGKNNTETVQENVTAVQTDIQ